MGDPLGSLCVEFFFSCALALLFLRSTSARETFFLIRLSGLVGELAGPHRIEGAGSKNCRRYGGARLAPEERKSQTVQIPPLNNPALEGLCEGGSFRGFLGTDSSSKIPHFYYPP